MIWSLNLILALICVSIEKWFSVSGNASYMLWTFTMLELEFTLKHDVGLKLFQQNRSTIQYGNPIYKKVRYTMYHVSKYHVYIHSIIGIAHFGRTTSFSSYSKSLTAVTHGWSG